MNKAIAALALTLALTSGTDQGPLEDQPGWNCATMGNQICGPDYEPDTGEYIGGYN
jgi:hypothetical protein